MWRRWSITAIAEDSLTSDLSFHAQPAEGLASPDPERVATGARPMGTSDLTVCLATINERENLPVLFSEIERCCGFGVDIVVVDDGSTDGTREFLASTSRTNPHVRYVLNGGPQTIVGAHFQGIAEANTPYVVMMDSDLQHPAEAIPQMLGSLRAGRDVVVASRHGKGGSTGPRSPFRGLVSRVAAALIQVFIKNTRQLSDPTSGFFGVRRDSLGPIPADLRGYETLIFILAAMEKPRVAEVPYTFRQRGNGQSKVLRGLSFLQVFLVQLVVAKRIELRLRNRPVEPVRVTPYDHSQASRRT